MDCCNSADEMMFLLSEISAFDLSGSATDAKILELAFGKAPKADTLVEHFGVCIETIAGVSVFVNETGSLLASERFATHVDNIVTTGPLSGMLANETST